MLSQPKIISSLSDLIANLNKCSGEEFSEIAHRIEIPFEDIIPLLKWSSSSYSRVCIQRNDRYELLLLCWEKNQVTPIHCHGGEECWVKIIKGQLLEKSYRLEDEHPYLYKQEQLTGTHLSHINDSMGLHSLGNMENERAVSLHLYVGPIDICHIWDEGRQEMLPKVLTYNS